MAREETNAQVLNNIDSEFINPIPVLIRVDTLLLRDMMKNWVFTVWVFLIVKWKKVLSVFCFLIMQAWIKWNLPLKFRNSFVRYVPVIKIEIIFVCCFQTAKSSGKCCSQTANGYLCI